jgi:pyruvate formate lyase activating enzyme
LREPSIDEQATMTTGQIFDIQRFAIHDGPGIRTTVFFKGCPLRCLWCGNPESISPQPQLSYVAGQCIGCQACLEVCPESALSLGPDGKVILDRDRCTACGKCAPECDPQALQMIGREVSVDEVMQVVLRDRDYYRASNGGITLSGGEPLFQPRFAEQLLRRAKAHRLHSVVETSGYALWGAIRDLVPLVDLWLFDYKETDPQRHEQYIGKPLPPILENLSRLHRAGAKILIRCPMIPQYNARTAHLDGIVALNRRFPKLEGVELLPYYDLWRAKLKRLGLASQLPDSVQPPDRETVRSWMDYLRQRGVRVVD